MKLKPVASLLLAGLVLAATIILLLPGSSSANQDRDALVAGSSARHLAGTDALGRDRLVRVCGALLLSLTGAVIASALTTTAAALVGTIAAFGPLVFGKSTMLLCDVFLALPWLFLLMMVRSVLPLTTSPMHSAVVTFLVLAALGWPACARAVYLGIANLRKSNWMLYARAGGLRPTQMVRCVLPNLVPLLLPQFLVCIPAFVIAEANLGALGLGLGEPLPSWGGMLLELDNSALLLRTPWVYLPIVLLVLVLLLLESMVVEV